MVVSKKSPTQTSTSVRPRRLATERQAAKIVKPKTPKHPKNFAKPKSIKSHKTATKSTTDLAYQEEQQRRSSKATSWQNPIINYFTSKYPNFRLKRPPQSRQKHLERQMMTMLAFFSISIGLWENFRQLWLQGNGFSATSVSNIISFGTIFGAVGVVFVGKFIKMPQLKRFMTVTLAFRCVNFLILAFLNHTNLTVLIVIFSVTEIFTGLLFLIAIYPLITTFIKNNDIYSRRRLVEYLFRDIGILIGGIFIGQQLGNFVFDYNACLLLATGFLVIATVIMYRLKLRVTEKAPESKFSAIKFVLHNKIQRVYMIYILLSETSAGVAIGLKMLMLTDMFGFSAGIATNYLLVVGLIADVLGILALKYFTPKNDYITLTLKFGIRFMIFSLAAISDSTFLSFLALTWMILSNTAYENITDGYYVNSVDNRYQFKYNTIRHVMQYMGTAIGTFLCGQVFGFGPAAVFGLSAFIIVAQMAPGYYLIYLRHHRSEVKNKRVTSHRSE